MRILFLSNFYPPARPGGYTQWCHEVAEGLRQKGHEISVLTSRHEAEKAPPDERHVYRLLHLEGDLVYYRPLHFFTKWKQQTRQNERTVASVISEVEPDLVFVWGMWAMSHAVPAAAERLLPSGVVYFLSDYWPASVDMHTKYWQQPARRWYMRLPRRLLSKFALAMIEREGRPKLKFEHAICVSAAVRQILVDAGIPLQQAHVIHGGTRLDGFRSIRQRSFNGSQLNLLYAGQLVEHKGVHTAVEAVAKLVNERNVRNLHLNVVGAGHPAYEASLARRVNDAHLEDYVSFKGRVAKEEMPEILEQADVLVFPSIYKEPFARMTQEAMLAGLVVVGTTTGGTKEILEDGENGLTFEAEDADDLARQLERLLDDPAFCTRLATSARRTVMEQFTLDRMVDRIEGYLELVAGDLQEAQRG